MEWKFEDDRPIYTQLVEQMEQAVVCGTYPPGARLPGVRELAAEAGVNPNTMQRALAELENQGLVHSQRTAGRFVTDDAGKIAALRAQLAAGQAGRYVQSMRALGCTPDEICGSVKMVLEEEENDG